MPNHIKLKIVRINYIKPNSIVSINAKCPTTGIGQLSRLMDSRLDINIKRPKS